MAENDDDHAPGHGLFRPPFGANGFGDYTLQDFAARIMMQQTDLAQTGYYAAANRAVLAEADTRPRVVIYGDSITEGWDLAGHALPALRLINRGISGQNSSQMLLRFMDDVVALKPAAVAILAGTNDLRAHIGEPASVAASGLARIRRNLTAMSDIATANGIRVILATLPPVGSDPQAVSRDADAFAAANRWITEFARARGFALADYHAALADDGGYLPVSLGEDGVHPNAAGYARMWPVLDAALRV